MAGLSGSKDRSKWGSKHYCGSCGKPFYDLNKSPIICPSCGVEHMPERLLKPRRSVGASPAEEAKKAAALKKKPVDLLDDDDLVDDLDADLDDDLIDPDTVDLVDDDEDDEDLSGVISAPKPDDE